MSTTIQNNLEIQADIAAKYNNNNGRLLLRISNILSWMVPNEHNIILQPTIGAGDRRRHQLEREYLQQLIK